MDKKNSIYRRTYMLIAFPFPLMESDGKWGNSVFSWNNKTLLLIRVPPPWRTLPGSPDRTPVRYTVSLHGINCRKGATVSCNGDTDRPRTSPTFGVHRLCLLPSPLPRTATRVSEVCRVPPKSAAQARCEPWPSATGRPRFTQTSLFRSSCLSQQQAPF